MAGWSKGGYRQDGHLVPCCKGDGTCIGYDGGNNRDYWITQAFHTPLGFRLLGKDGRYYFTSYALKYGGDGLSIGARERMKILVEGNLVGNK